MSQTQTIQPSQPMIEPELQATIELESKSPQTTTNLESETNLVNFPLSKVKAAKILDTSDTTIGNWVKALESKGKTLLDTKGRITSEGFEELEKLAKATKQDGIPLSDYLDSVGGQLATVSTVEVSEVKRINANAAITKIDREIATLEADLMNVDIIISDYQKSSLQFEEIAIKRARLSGLKIGINTAKAKIAGMQQGENAMLEKLINEAE